MAYNIDAEAKEVLTTAITNLDKELRDINHKVPCPSTLRQSHPVSTVADLQIRSIATPSSATQSIRYKFHYHKNLHNFH